MQIKCLHIAQYINLPNNKYFEWFTTDTGIAKFPGQSWYSQLSRITERESSGLLTNDTYIGSWGISWIHTRFLKKISDERFVMHKLSDRQQ